MVACDIAKKEVVLKIENWFQESARDFPWRVTSTPWGRLMSEFMSQQTQVTRVAQRWPEMMQQFPTPKSMAKQDIESVLLLWQGLGYYRRARHLKQTAEMIEREFSGVVPSSVDQLLQLPGVGKYTAGAIASIVYHQKVPIVDGNVHRVLCRLANKSEVPNPTNWSWELAEQLVVASNDPSLFNEGLMELGATICTPKSPKCEACPVRVSCRACAAQTQSEIPPPKKLKPRLRVHHHAVVLTCRGELAMEQRGSDGLWANMWQVPTIESSTPLRKSEVTTKLGVLGELVPIGKFEHLLSHRVVEFHVYTCEIERETRFIWQSIDKLDELPLASAQRKVLNVHCIV